MNIYITPKNEKRLREYEGSMSGLINSLLDDHYSSQTEQSSIINESINPENVKIINYEKEAKEPVNYDLEQMRDLSIPEQVEMLGYKWDPIIKQAWDDKQERHWPVVVEDGLVEVKAL